jgi:hypothetical protein
LYNISKVNLNLGNDSQLRFIKVTSYEVGNHLEDANRQANDDPAELHILGLEILRYNPAGDEGHEGYHAKDQSIMES